MLFGCCLFGGKHIFEDGIYRLTRYKLVIVVEYVEIQNGRITKACFNPLAHCFYCLDASCIGRGGMKDNSHVFFNLTKIYQTILLGENVSCLSRKTLLELIYIFKNRNTSYDSHSSKIIFNKVPDASQSVSQSVYSPGLLHCKTLEYHIYAVLL